MSIRDLKFSSGDFSGKDISSLPDRPQISTAELKARFDSIGKSMLALGSFNGLVDALTANTGAGEIGTTSGRSLQTELDMKAVRHSPSFTGIPTADTPPRGSDTTQLATTAFVNRALGDGGYGNMMREIYDSQGRECDVFAYADSKATVEHHTFTLGTDWEGVGPYTCDISLEGIRQGDCPKVDVVLSDDAETAKAEIEAYSKIGRMTVVGEGVIRAYCYESTPGTALTIQLEVVR
ncbi:MAG: hypothetical protein IKM04_02190 [Clostridia bacterium]|nr:hypothetical protein [Clostridia bacterium]